MTSQRPAAPERGAVLVLAIMVMTALIVVGVAYLDVATFQARASMNGRDRLDAFAIAEGGIDAGYQHLTGNPTFRGTIERATGDWSFTVKIFRVGDDRDVHSTGTASGRSVSVLSRALITPGEAALPTSPFRVLGSALVSTGGSFSWAGDLLTNGSVKTAGGGTATGSWLGDQKLAPIEIDLTSFETEAAQIVDSDLLLTTGDYFLSRQVNGNLTIDGAVKITAPWLVTGSVTVTPGSTLQLLENAPDKTILMVLGDLILDACAQFQLTGVVTVNGDIFFTGVPDAYGVGALFTNGHLMVDSSTVQWSFNPGQMNDTPDYVLGLGTPTVIEEAWRRRAGN